MNQLENMNFSEIVAYEKSQMLPLNFVMSYVLAPIYAAISFLLIGAFCVLMEIDDTKFLFPGLICLGVWLLITIIFLLSVPFVRKKAIAAEMQRYDFDTSNVEAAELWNFSTDDFSLKFDRFGMYVNDKLFYYTHLYKQIITSNYCKRVGIYLQFALSKEQAVTLYVNPVTLKLLQSLDIQLENQQTLEYILSNKEDAFRKIYDKGHLGIL